MYIYVNVLVSNFYKFCYWGHFIIFCKLLAPVIIQKDSNVSTVVLAYVGNEEL